MDDLKLMTYIAVGLSFALYIGVAIWARAGSTKDYYVAGVGCTPWSTDGNGGGLDVGGVVYFDGRFDFCNGLRWFGLSHGLDWGLCAVGGVARPVPAEIR